MSQALSIKDKINYSFNCFKLIILFPDTHSDTDTDTGTDTDTDTDTVMSTNIQIFEYSNKMALE